MIVSAILSMGSFGPAIAMLPAVAGHIFHVDEDSRFFSAPLPCYFDQMRIIGIPFRLT